MLDQHRVKTTIGFIIALLVIAMMPAGQVWAQDGEGESGGASVEASTIDGPNDPVRRIRSALPEAIREGHWGVVADSMRQLANLWRPNNSTNSPLNVWVLGYQPRPTQLPYLLQYAAELQSQSFITAMMGSELIPVHGLVYAMVVVGESAHWAEVMSDPERVSRMVGDGPRYEASTYRSLAVNLRHAQTDALVRHRVGLRIAQRALASPDATVRNAAFSYLDVASATRLPGDRLASAPSDVFRYMQIVDARDVMLDPDMPLELRAHVFSSAVAAVAAQDDASRPMEGSGSARADQREVMRRLSSARIEPDVRENLRANGVPARVIEQFGAHQASTLVTEALTGSPYAGAEAGDLQAYRILAPVIEEAIAGEGTISIEQVRSVVWIMADMMRASRVELGTIAPDAMSALTALQASGDMERLEAAAEKVLAQPEDMAELLDSLYLRSRGSSDGYQAGTLERARGLMAEVVGQRSGNTLGVLAAVASLSSDTVTGGYTRAGRFALMNEWVRMMADNRMPGFVAQDVMARMVDAYIEGGVIAMEGSMEASLAANEFRGQRSSVFRSSSTADNHMDISIADYTAGVIRNLSGTGDRGGEPAALQELLYLIEYHGETAGVLEAVSTALESELFLDAYNTFVPTDRRTRALDQVRQAVAGKRAQMARGYLLIAALSGELGGRSETAGLRESLASLVAASTATPAGGRVVAMFEQGRAGAPAGLPAEVAGEVRAGAEGREMVASTRTSMTLSQVAVMHRTEVVRVRAAGIERAAVVEAIGRLGRGANRPVAGLIAEVSKLPTGAKGFIGK